MSFIPGVVRDGVPFFHKFGDVLADAESEYQLGSTAKATFVAANPRNNLHLEGTYAAVERRVDLGQDGDGTWKVVRDDTDWSLTFSWRRTSEILGTSEAEITWEIEDDAEPGVYRLRYFGDARALGGSVTEFEGACSAFRVS
jgi:neutral ceramidase